MHDQNHIKFVVFNCGNVGVQNEHIVGL